MTFQERNAEGPPVGPDELLTPEEVQEALTANRGGLSPWIKRLCQDYLTLWDRNRYNVDLLTAEVENLQEWNKELEANIRIVRAGL